MPVKLESKEEATTKFIRRLFLAAHVTVHEIREVRHHIIVMAWDLYNYIVFTNENEDPFVGMKKFDHRDGAVDYMNNLEAKWSLTQVEIKARRQVRKAMDAAWEAGRSHNTLDDDYFDADVHDQRIKLLHSIYGVCFISYRQWHDDGDYFCEQGWVPDLDSYRKFNRFMDPDYDDSYVEYIEPDSCDPMHGMPPSMDDVAEWVGLHYGRNFDAMTEEDQEEWIARFVEAHHEEYVQVGPDNNTLRATMHTIFTANQELT